MVTFLLTDIEGSSRMWEADPRAMRAVLALHDRLVHDGIEDHDGTVLTSHGEGDSLFGVFPRALDAVAAAAHIQRALAGGQWPDGVTPRVRMAIHTGDAGPPDYRGPAANRCGRLRGCAHGGQVVLSRTAAEQAQPLPPGISLRDLGEHGLRDMSRPERVFQLVVDGLPAGFPPLRSLGTFSHNLPVQLTSFIGRERETRQVRQLLAAHRLVTLTGAGGCGKSRLALQVAADALDDYPGGAWFVGLASLADPDLVLQSVAAALGIQDEPGHGLLDTVTGRLREKPILLLLDNCEHLVSACAELVMTLVAGCPDLRVLATSRHVLNVQGELAWRVPSMAVPEPRASASAGHVRRFETVALFLDRAAGVRPGFRLDDGNAATIAQICTRLEGIPLAIEIAAARLRVMDADEILDRLRDRFRLLTGGGRSVTNRHQTLRTAIDWSHDLLSPMERVLLRRLSVFAGGWSLAAAEAVCPDSVLAAEQVLELLGHLVDKSLVVVTDGADGTRYGMLETLREYSAERLRTDEDADALRRRHLEHFVGVAEGLDVEQGGKRDAVRKLAADRDNYTAALDVARRSDHDALLRLACSLAWSWSTSGRLREGRRWLTEALLLRTERSPRRALALKGLARLAAQQRDYSTATSLLIEAIAIFESLGDDLAAARCCNNLGVVAHYQGELVDAIEHYETALRAYRRLGHRRGMAISLSNLGLWKSETGTPDDGQRDLEEALSIVRTLDDDVLWAECLANCGINAIYRDDLTAARSFYLESLQLAFRHGDSLKLATGLEGFALLAAARGDAHQAILLTAAVIGLRQRLDVPLSPMLEGRYHRWLGPLRAALSPEAYEDAWQEGLSMTVEQATTCALGCDEELTGAVPDTQPCAV